MSALALPKADEHLDLQRRFIRRGEIFEIKTYVEQDDDASSASVKVVEKRKNMPSSLSSHGKSDKRATHRIAPNSKWTR